MSDGATGGAVPGATMTEVRRRWRATAIGKGRDAPTQGDTQWLVAEALAAWDRIDALTEALVEAEAARAANAALVEAYYEAVTDYLDILARHARPSAAAASQAAWERLRNAGAMLLLGAADARRAATTTEEDADGD